MILSEAYFRRIERGQSQRYSRDIAIANSFLKLTDNLPENEWVAIRWYHRVIEQDGGYQTLRFTIETEESQ